MGLVAVIAAYIVTSRRVPIVSRRVGVTVAVRWVTVTVAVRRIAIAVGLRRDRAADYRCGNAGADPATYTPRLRRLRGNKGCCGNTGSRDNGRDRLAHGGILQDVATPQGGIANLLTLLWEKRRNVPVDVE